MYKFNINHSVSFGGGGKDAILSYFKLHLATDIANISCQRK